MLAGDSSPDVGGVCDMVGGAYRSIGVVIIIHIFQMRRRNGDVFDLSNKIPRLSSHNFHFHFLVLDTMRNSTTTSHMTFLDKMAVVAMLTGLVQRFVDYLVENPFMICVLFVVYVILYALSLVLFKKSGPNPFQNDCSKPARGLVIDQTARDKVLKQGFSQKKVPENVDVIVIGSGIGGLSTAALLSLAGKRVLVLEQHDQAGGCCHTFIEKGFEFDVGIHYIGKLFDGSVSHTILSQLTQGQLQWERLNDVYDTVSIGLGDKRQLFPIPGSGQEDYHQTLIKWFPEEKENIDRYMDLLDKADKSFIGGFYVKVLPRWLSWFLVKTGLIRLTTGFYDYAGKSVTEVLDTITDNKTLKTILAYNYGDYGTVPDEASFIMHVTLVKHFMKGGYYPRGGASEIAFNIIPTIEEAGGKVLVRAPVSQILIDDSGRACGVRVSKTSGDVDVKAPLIISAAGVINTYKTLLPKHIREKSVINSLLSESRIKSGVAGMSVFIGLDASKEELNLEPMNVWAFTRPDLDATFHEYINLSADEACQTDIPLLFISFPSTKDPTWDERYPGKTTLAIITLAPWRWFEQWENERVMHRGEEYDGIKHALAERMWQQVCDMYPQIADKKVYMEVGSPLTNQFYISAPRGEFYGLDHDVARFSSPEVGLALRPDTEVPGLWLSGQDVASCGFSGALFGGIICASAILNRNLISDVVRLRKQIRQAKRNKEE